MFRRPSFALMITAFALLAAQSAWSTGLKICNRTSVGEIAVAIGYYRESRGWESDGWYMIASNDCTDMIDRMNDRYYYLYAKSSDKFWDGDGKRWSTNFCIKPRDPFSLDVASLSSDGDNPDCEKHGYVTKRFMRIDTEDHDDYTFELND